MINQYVCYTTTLWDHTIKSYTAQTAVSYINIIQRVEIGTIQFSIINIEGDDCVLSNISVHVP